MSANFAPTSSTNSSITSANSPSTRRRSSIMPTVTKNSPSRTSRKGLMSSSTWKRNSVSAISIPARNAPSTRDRPARPVTKASSSVTSSTFRTNSSFERRRATIPSQARISLGPRVITTASASTALPRAMATAAPSASADWSSAGSSTSKGTTARSWNSSMPMTWRPCAVSSSSRSASSLETIAVEDIAAMPPRVSPACHEAPAASAAPTKQLASGPGALDIARRVLAIEADAVRGLIERLDERFLAALSLIHGRRGRVIVSGIGKSGHIARKIASTLSSTGTPAYFVHPAEASHGDLGMIESGDVFVAISYSGSSEELLEIVPLVKRRGAKLIAMTGRADSALAREADVLLDAAVEQEACPHNLAPTASTTAALALGDALAVALLSARGFSADDFARSHPRGRLPRQALVHVADVMRRGNDMPCVKNGVPAMQAVVEMSRSRMGMTAVVDEAGRVRGIFTDGDLRRSLEKGADFHATAVDGLGLQMLRQSGVHAAILSGRTSSGVAARALELGIEHVLQGIGDKLAAYRSLIERLGLTAEQTGYMGDDLVDIPVLARCGFACVPGESPEEVRRRAHYVCAAPAGRGAVREACEFLMRAQGTMDRVLPAHLK